MSSAQHFLKVPDRHPHAIVLRKIRSINEFDRLMEREIERENEHIELQN